MRATSLASLLFAVSSLVACSSLSEDAGSSDDTLKINPEGTENMSTLIVQLPTGACMPGGSCAHPLAANPNIALDSTAMTIGTPIRVAPGDHKLAVSGTTKTVTLVAGATRTMVLPVVKKSCQNVTGSTVTETDFGRVPSLRNAACPSAATIDGNSLYNGALDAFTLDLYAGQNCTSTYLYQLTLSYPCTNLTVGSYSVQSARANGVCVNVPIREWRAFCDLYVQNGAAAIAGGSLGLSGETAVVPGTYGFPVESASGGTTNETRVVAEGDVKTLSFTLSQIGTIPDRFSTNLKFNDARELPDAFVGQITSDCGERNYAIPASASGTLALKAFKFADCAYQLSVGGRSVSLNQAADNNIPLYRLDIGDVVITREDGSTYTTRGSYEVYFGGIRVAGPFNTNTGLDVLGGAYEVVVKYNTAEGPKTNRYNVTF